MLIRELIPVTISIVALVLGGLSLWNARRAFSASLFDQKFQVFKKVQTFLQAWSQAGKPDMELLKLLGEAKEEAHFLYSNRIVEYIEEIELAALSANVLVQRRTALNGILERADVAKLDEIQAPYILYSGRLTEAFSGELKP